MLLFHTRENNLWVKQKCVVLFNKAIPEFNILYYFESIRKTSYKPVYSTINACKDKKDTCNVLIKVFYSKYAK